MTKWQSPRQPPVMLNGGRSQSSLGRQAFGRSGHGKQQCREDTGGLVPTLKGHLMSQKFMFTE